MITPAPITPGAPLRVSILVFDEVEVLDCCGPFEVFSVANRVLARRGLPAGFEVCLVATTPEVTARGGLVLRTHATLDAVPPADVLLVAGGVTDVVERDPAVLAHVAGSPAAIIASVCTGAFVLAAAGVVTTQTVTTHAEDVDDLAVRWPAVRVVRGQRWVRDGHIYTSGGISAGIDLSLHLVGVLAGTDLARATADQMEYRWVPEQ
jgi:transcriptional regulator GlxA family with amidase domain